MQSRIISDLKAQEYLNMIATIEAFELDFNAIIPSRNNNFLIRKLDDFIKELEKEKLESKLAKQLDANLPSVSNSLIDQIIENTSEILKNNTDLKLTKHQFIFKFYMFIIYQVVKVNKLMLMAVELRNRLNGLLITFCFECL
jgi:hypothetical protein